MTNNTNQNIERVKSAVKAIYKQLEELNEAVDNLIDDYNIKLNVSMALESYYRELPDTELLDDIMDLIMDEEDVIKEDEEEY